MSIGDGEMVGIIGRSGAGKSTLLRLINRLIDPSAGRIIHDGTDVTALRGKELRAWRARTAMIFQQFNLVNRLDVLTNVMCGRLYRNSGARGAAELVHPDGTGAGNPRAGSAGDGGGGDEPGGCTVRRPAAASRDRRA